MEKKAEKKVTRNVTLSLPENLLRRFRVHAATKNQSMSQLMTEAIRRMLEQDLDREAAKRRILERMRNSPDRGIGEKIPWTRADLYDR